MFSGNVPSQKRSILRCSSKANEWTTNRREYYRGGGGEKVGEQKGILTTNFEIGALLAGTDVDEIKERPTVAKTSKEGPELAAVFEPPGTFERRTQSPDIRKRPHHNIHPNRGISHVAHMPL